LIFNDAQVYFSDTQYYALK